MAVDLTSGGLGGQRVLVYGLGRFGGGAGVVGFLSEAGAVVSIADDADEDQLRAPIESLRDIEIAEWFLGGGSPSLDAFDLVVANPGLKPTHPLFAQAEAAGVVVVSEIELFLANNPAEVVAVTGSNGKSTTSAMIAHVLKHAGLRCHLGGNLGGSLLATLPAIEPDDIVVLELSSFQLSRLREEHLSPRVAVVTNFVANHLDWHGSLDHYSSSKQRLLAFSGPSCAAVLPTNGDDVAAWPTRARRLCFGDDLGENGVFVSDGTVVFRTDQTEEGLPLWHLRLPGSHNVSNSLAAAVACFELGVEPTAIGDAFASFTGLPFRLQRIGCVDGRVFVNDSASTTPESTIEALQAFAQRVVLIAGGAEKGVDLRPLAESAANRAKSAHWIGTTADVLLKHATSCDEGFHQSQHETLSDAFSAAVDVSKPGDIVILSPGCASFGMYANFADRGRHFDQLVERLSRSES